MTHPLTTPSFKLLPKDEKCRICGSPRMKSVGRKKSAFSRLDFEYLECRVCGFRFVEPKISPDQIYNDLYYKGLGADPLVNYEAEYCADQNSLRKLEFMDFFKITCNTWEKSGFLSGLKNIHWLDFGCGAGGMLRFLDHQKTRYFSEKHIDLRLTGHDQSPYADRLKADGFQILDDEELKKLPEGSFDVISCIEVIEHVLDPQDLLSVMSRLLKPHGLLLLTTGNIKSPLSRMMGFKYNYCTAEVHISLFHPKLLVSMYKKSGLMPFHVKYSDCLEYRILKNLGKTWSGKPLFQWVARNRFTRALIDWLFGVSQMPWAIKTD